MKTRSARQLDYLGIRKLAATPHTAVVIPTELDDVPGLTKAALVPGREKTWVAEDRGVLAGFVQARPRSVVLGWEIIRVHVHPDCEPVQVVGALVQEMLGHLQEKGIPRLFARTQIDSEGHLCMNACGFTHLTSESVFLREAQKTPPPEEMPTGMRYRMPQDAWPLRQLESSQTPQMVSQLEGLTSLNWSMPRQRRWGKDRTSELVVERDGELAGWVGWVFVGVGGGCRDHVRLGILAHTDDTEMAAAMVEYALHAISGERPTARIIVRLRDYQMPLNRVLEDHGFTEVFRETLHIKHGRLQLLPKRVSRLLEFVPTVRAFSLESRQK